MPLVALSRRSQLALISCSVSPFRNIELSAASGIWSNPRGAMKLEKAVRQANLRAGTVLDVHIDFHLECRAGIAFVPYEARDDDSRHSSSPAIPYPSPRAPQHSQDAGDRTYLGPPTYRFHRVIPSTLPQSLLRCILHARS